MLTDTFTYLITCNWKKTVQTVLQKSYLSVNPISLKKKMRTCQDVLEEICQYLGLTAIADGNSVYFLDYDAIKQGITTYYRYTVGNTSQVTNVNVSYNKLITASDYSENGATLSLDKVYNKVSVEDDFYTFDNILPDFYKEANNITKDSDSAIENNTSTTGGKGEVVSNNGENIEVFVDRVYNPQKGQYDNLNVVFVKYYNNPHYTFYQYDGGTRTEVDELNYTDTKRFYGGFIGQYGVQKLDQLTNVQVDFLDQLFGDQITLDQWLAYNGISNVNLSNYVCLINSLNSGEHIDNTNITSYPYLVSTGNSATLFGGGYLIIEGSVIFHYFGANPYPIPEGEADISEGRYKMAANEGYLLAKLQWGRWCWSGSRWSELNRTFMLPYVKEGETPRADSVMFKSNDIVNTVSWRIGTSEKGYCIEVPDDMLLEGQPTLTLYKPYDPTYIDHGQYYKNACVFLKDFEIKPVVADPTLAGDSETVYTNIINDDYVQSLEDVKFKVCTWDNKKPNYSSVAYQYDTARGVEFAWVDKIYNQACSFSGVTDHNGQISDGSLRMEEQFIYKVTNQYSTPSVKLILNLRNNNKIYGLYTNTTIAGKQFIVDSINTDYKMNSQEVTLIEKK